jgi:hypothetical protein
MRRVMAGGAAALLAMGLAASCGAQGWANVYDASRDSRALAVPRFSDACPWSGGIAVSADGSFSEGSVLMRLAPGGAVVEASHVGDVAITGLRALSDDSLIFAGLAAVVPRHAVVGRVLPGGALAWAVDVGAVASSAETAVDLTASGRILVALETTPPDPLAIRVIELDASGTILGAWDLPGLAAGAFQRRPALAALADGGVAVGGVTAREAGVVVKLDALRAVAWQRRAASGCELAALAAQPDSSVDVACDTTAGLTTLTSLSASGATSWQLALPASGTTRRVTAAANGDVLVVQSLAWLARVAADGSGIAWERHASANDGVVSHLPTGETVMAADPGLVVRFDATGALSGPCSRVQPLGVTASAGALTWDLPALTAQAVAVSAAPLAPTLQPLAVDVHPTCTAWGCEVDAFEPDEGCGATATELVAGIAQVHDACEDAEDWMLVKTCAGIPLVVTTSALGPAADTVIELWSFDCSRLLAADDNGGGGLASRLVYVPAQDGALFVRVAQADASFGPGREWTLLREPDACVPVSWHLSSYFGGIDEGAVAETTSGAAVARGDWWEPPGDYAVARFDLAGRIERVTSFPPTPGSREMEVLCADSSGDAVMVGGAAWSSSPRFGGTSVPWVASITPSDQLAWVSLPDFARGLEIVDVAAHADGSVTAVVATDTDDVEPPAFLVRVDAAGGIAWAKALPPDAIVRAFAAHPDGGVIVATTDLTPRSRITRLDSAGAEAWTTILDVDLRPRSISVGPSGRVFVGIERFGLSAFVALEPDGSLAWARRLLPDTESALLRPRSDGTMGFVLNDGGWTGAFTEGGDLLYLREREDPSELDHWEPLSLRDGYIGIGSDVGRLDALGGFGDCEEAPLVRAFLAPMPLVTLPGSSGLAPLTVATTIVGGTPQAEPVSSSLECGTIGCPPLEVDVVGSRQACVGVDQPYGVAMRGVVGDPGRVEWDFNYDGFTFDVDATGEPILWAFPGPEGDHRVAVRATDDCVPPRTALGEMLVQARSPVGGAILGASSRCSGDACTLLEAPPGSSDWMWWPDGQNTASICVSPAVTTTYSVSGLDAVGCNLGAEHEVEVILPPTLALIVDCEPPGARIRSLVTDCPGCAYAWDSGETTPEILAPPGVTRALTITTSDGCSATMSADSGPPCFVGEVSAPGRIPLRAARAGADVALRFERRAEATAYNILGNDIGTWIAAGGFACRATPWVDEGDGSITLGLPIPANSWFVVTASNPDGEGAAGRDSQLVERSTRPGWIGCGPAP